MNTLTRTSSTVALRPGSVSVEVGNAGCGRRSAFTLIELLVVVAVIALLAAMLFPAGAAIKRRALVKRVQAELAQLEMAINQYKTDKGFYPPDNPANASASEIALYLDPAPSASWNSLYYELAGASVIDSGNPMIYETLGSRERVVSSVFTSSFGVGGIMNADTGRREAGEAKNYMQTFKPAQYSNVPSIGDLKVMSTAAEGPMKAGPESSRFCYVTSSEWQRNTETFDLWVDIIVGSETKRISNWSDDPEVVVY